MVNLTWTRRTDGIKSGCITLYLLLYLSDSDMLISSKSLDNSWFMTEGREERLNIWLSYYTIAMIENILLEHLNTDKGTLAIARLT